MGPTRAVSPRRTVTLALALVLAGCGGLAGQAPPADAPPRLGVLLVVDQLRGDLLDRYDDLFTGGLRRLRDEGRVFPHTTHDHLVTETAPGHATLATGTWPARHGVVANHWYERRPGGWRGVENVIDPDSPLLGAPSLVGASPSVLERSGVADWVRDAGGRVVAVSGKPRGAVLLGGRDRAPVYWFEPGLGRFVTSTWYADEDPAWITSFNEEEIPAFASDSVWESTVPAAARARSRPDSVGYESDGERTTFPHRFVEAQAAHDLDFWTWFSTTPELDRATLLLARRAVEAEGLGLDDEVDLLAVSLSQTDRVGHAFGPLSREQLDNLLRLDRALGEFFDYLDRVVGKGAWTVAFSSDHGAQDAPEWERAAGIEAIRLTQGSLETLQQAVNRAAREAGTTDAEKLAGPLAVEVEALPWIARAWTHARLESDAQPADTFELLARRSHRSDRPTGLLGRLGVQYMLEPHVLPFGYPEGGSTHQSGYYHDRHVPFVVMGAGVIRGVDTVRASTTDVAATLAALLGVEVPDDLDGVARSVAAPAPGGRAREERER